MSIRPVTIEFATEEVELKLTARTEAEEPNLRPGKGEQVEPA